MGGSPLERRGNSHEKKAAVRRLNLPPDHRVLAISDIHGNLPFFQGLLKKVSFGPEDILFLVGDLVEKSTGSLDTLHYVMELAGTHTVYPICGNCDNLTVSFFQDTQRDEDFYPFFQTWGEKSLLLQMAAQLGMELDGVESLAPIRRAVQRAFPEELAYLQAMPTIVETQNLLLVHGGVPGEHALEELNAWACMKNDDFLSSPARFERHWCVVGHWPVTLYREEIPSAAPILDRARKIISIDGGCVLKLDGQLNALIQAESGSEEFSWAAFDGLEEGTALDGQAPSPHSVNIRWGRNQVRPLKEAGEFVRCRHVETGRELWILRDYLYRQGDELRCQDSTDYLLPVTPGDRLSIVRKTSRGYLAKKAGVTGWYRGRITGDRGRW